MTTKMTIASIEIDGYAKNDVPRDGTLGWVNLTVRVGDQTYDAGGGWIDEDGDVEPYAYADAGDDVDRLARDLGVSADEVVRMLADITPASVRDEWAQQQPVTVRAWDSSYSDETARVRYGRDYETVARRMYEDADYGDGDWCERIDWEAIDCWGDQIDSGYFEIEHESEEPQCPDGDAHDWTSEYEDGLDENPGVWGLGGTAMLFVAHCRHCGMERRQHKTGSQRNPGECDTTEYSDPDPDWVERNVEDSVL